jgi:gamma-glutamyl:cysteine ligase YbdK (ATP-grasp superfamily)
MQPLHHGELLLLVLVLLARAATHAGMQCKHARSLFGRPYRTNHCKAMAWAGMPAAVRAKVAFLLVFYSILESSRCRKTLFVWFSIRPSNARLFTVALSAM